MTLVMDGARAFEAIILAGPEVAGFIGTFVADQGKAEQKYKKGGA
jgi:hypothetical protein